LLVFEAGGAGTASLEVWQEGAGSAAGCARHFHRLIILLWGAECKTLCVYRGTGGWEELPDNYASVG
jgi:hypothetical protein